MTTHDMSALKLGDGLYMFTCSDGCSRSFSVGFDKDGYLDYANMEMIAEGDSSVPHSGGLGGLRVNGVSVKE